MWPLQRAGDQRDLVTGLYRGGRGVPRGREAVMAGGMRGADKDGALARAGVDRSGYLTISIDVVLLEMAARGLIPRTAGQSPLQAADQVHAEAQHLAKRVGLLALTDGRNLILDVSLASSRAAEAWMYALRFAGYTVTAVFTEIAAEEAVRWSEDTYQRGEEEYRAGRGYGGRHIPAAAIRALADPAVAAARNRIAWASGARATASPPRGMFTGAGLPASAVTTMIASYRAGRLTLDDLRLEFRARRWATVPAVCPPGLEPASAAIDDPEPYVPGSFDDVTLAYDLGQLSGTEYALLAGE
ncbi:MAG: zeta toxin family protein, partial [Actinomycetota bacterium]